MCARVALDTATGDSRQLCKTNTCIIRVALSRAVDRVPETSLSRGKKSQVHFSSETPTGEKKRKKKGNGGAAEW